jgi:hypothetical protein
MPLIGAFCRGPLLYGLLGIPDDMILPKVEGRTNQNTIPMDRVYQMKMPCVHAARNSTKPTKTAANPKKTLAKQCRMPDMGVPSNKASSSSSEKVEKVVNPPQNPTPKSK